MNFLFKIKQDELKINKEVKLKFGLMFSDFLRKVLTDEVFVYFDNLANDLQSEYLAIDLSRFLKYDFSNISDLFVDLPKLKKESLTYELFYSIFAVFNEISNDIYTQETYNLIKSRLKKDGRIACYERTSCPMLIRTEELLIRNNFLQLQADKLIYCEENIAVGSLLFNEIGFISKKQLFFWDYWNWLI